MSHKVVIVGCGFGGLWSVKNLHKKSGIAITVLDKKNTFDFLPLIPDIIGRELKPEHLQTSIPNLQKKYGFHFINEQAREIDLENRIIPLKNHKLAYDYLILAPGVETSYYGNEDVKSVAYPLRSVRDSVKIKDTLLKNEYETILVAGGGYTGTEIATNIRLLLEKKKSDTRIIIVEIAETILGSLPDWIKHYTRENLKSMNIEIIHNQTIKKVTDNIITLTDQTQFPNSLLIWVAGVKPPPIITRFNLPKIKGRLKTNSDLSIAPNAYAIGDSSAFLRGNSPLRMAIQFTIQEAKTASHNILASIQNKQPKHYHPRDPGYIVPLANNHSSGVIFNKNQKGPHVTFLHYFMSIYRSQGIKNKAGILKDLILQ